MRLHRVLLRSVIPLLFLWTIPCLAIDWEAFDDPQAVLITDAFAKSISDLPKAEKSASMKRLLESLNSPEVEIRRRAALTLHQLGDASGVPVMIQDLSTATGRDRSNVLVALRILKDNRSIPVLRASLKDKSAYVRCIAVAALGEMKAKQAYDEIVAMIKDKGEKPAEKKPGTLNCFPEIPGQMACYALGAMGDKRAIPVLIKHLDDNDLQHPAIQALEVLANQKLGNSPDKWKEWWRDQPK